MVRTDAALARVVVKAAARRALVQGQNRIGAQAAKTHGRNIEYRSRIRLCTLLIANLHAKIFRIALWRRQNGVHHEFIAILVHINNRAKRLISTHCFGTLIHQRTLRTGKRQCLIIGFYQILTYFRPYALKQPTKMPNNRIIAQHAVLGLLHIVSPNQRGQQCNDKHHILCAFS